MFSKSPTVNQGEIACRAVLLAALLVGNAAPSPQFRPIGADEAIAYFKRLCVDTMPSPNAFAATLNAEPAGWNAIEKSDGRIPVIGHFWRSPLGELGYINLPGIGQTNPACHYTFRTAPDYNHEQTADALIRLLRLDRGRQTGKKKAPQTRWEAKLPNGVRIRLFLSSAVRDLDAPAATLSVSAYPDGRRGR